MNSKTLLLAELTKATKDNPLYRFDFAEKVNMTERQVRKDIEELRNKGYRICSDSSGHGYWLAKSEKEYIRFRAEYISRAVKIFETVSKMDMTTEGQIGGLEN
jgi:biotin operon repressor